MNTNRDAPRLTVQQKTALFETMITQYLEDTPILKTDGKTKEVELRFGTNTYLATPLSKIDYDNVVIQLRSAGFKTQNSEGTQMLRIISDYMNVRLGQRVGSNTRVEISGTDLIQEYCRTNSIQHILDMPSTLSRKIKFTQKIPATDKDGKSILPVYMDDFNFNASYQLEKDHHVNTNMAKDIISEWSDSKKKFRCMNRVRFYHDELPIFADLSIIKVNKVTKNARGKSIQIPEVDIQKAGVFTNPETYEIELEIDNRRVGGGSAYNTTPRLMAAIKKGIRIILSGLQGTKFPISYVERERVLQSYMQLVRGEEYKQRRVKTKDFIGPSSTTLHVENIMAPSEYTSTINIRENYTVTDKADGDRKLLYIADDGKIYMIDTNMRVIFTGTKTAEKTIMNSLLDGEHIKFDKNGKHINLYAAFDVYFINRLSKRNLAFVPEKPEDLEENFRLPLLQKCIDLIKPISILGDDKSVDLIIKCKEFHQSSSVHSIFAACDTILSKSDDGTFDYKTDGLIFTPSNLAVGASFPGRPAGSLNKVTWNQSFKWKPAEFNTIDFLVSMKKDKTGKDEVHHSFLSGRNNQGVQELEQYKTLVLLCGFNPDDHGYPNAYQDVIQDIVPTLRENANEKNYLPTPFLPTNPYDKTACFCNVKMVGDGNLLTEDGEYFEEDMIVEFKYVEANEDGWRWVPLRVRNDKTSELRAGGNNYGNAYHVANSNWRSIHRPVTDNMIRRGKDIPESIPSEDVYYNRSKLETSTQGLRDFHNLYVKKKLIMGVSNRGDILIDYAVGKAGDLSKWIHSHLSFIFGIDISKDNIHNQLDGACSRYLSNYSTTPNMPKALFTVGNSGFNIRSGKAFPTDKDKQITRAVFGQGEKDKVSLGLGVFNQYGRAATGFNVSSCQFAMHYFFENPTLFHNFLRNVAECTRINGYFIGTCYDGETVFKLLKNYKRDEGFTIMKEGRKIYEIMKMYDQTSFPDDEQSLGYAVNVYQESINKVFREYLVNFKFVIRMMENYGFRLVKKQEAKLMDLPDGTGLFNELFGHMEEEIDKTPGRRFEYGVANTMTPEEKRISYMNRYFIFKKVRAVDATQLAKLSTGEDIEEIVPIGEMNVPAPVPASVPVPSVPIAPIARKIKKPKLVLVQPTVLAEPRPAAETRPDNAIEQEPTTQKIRIKVKKPVL